MVTQIRLRGSTLMCINVYSKERQHFEQDGDMNKVQQLRRQFCVLII